MAPRAASTRGLGRAMPAPAALPAGAPPYASLSRMGWSRRGWGDRRICMSGTSTAIHGPRTNGAPILPASSNSRPFPPFAWPRVSVSKPAASRLISHPPRHRHVFITRPRRRGIVDPGRPRLGSHLVPRLRSMCHGETPPPQPGPLTCPQWNDCLSSFNGTTCSSNSGWDCLCKDSSALDTLNSCIDTGCTGTTGQEGKRASPPRVLSPSQLRQLIPAKQSMPPSPKSAPTPASP